MINFINNLSEKTFNFVKNLKMKNTQKNILIKPVIVLIIALFSMISCRSDDNTDTSSLVGDWEWASTYGGIANITETPTTTGNTILLSFTSDNKYTIKTNGIVTSEGTFTLYKDVSNLEHYERTYINFSNYSTKMIANNDDENLILGDDVNDGFTYTYKKKK